MHYTVVVACSKISGDGEPLRLTSGGAGSNAAGAESSSVDASSESPSTDTPPSLGMPIAEAMAAESGSRLKARWYVSEDGARQWAFNWFDTERNEECSFQIGGDGVRRCLPTGTAAPTYYLDAACSDQVLAIPASTCEPAAPRYIVQSEIVGCEAHTRLFTPGPLVRPKALYIKSASACTETAVAETLSYRRPGTEVAAANFAAAEEKRDP